MKVAKIVPLVMTGFLVAGPVLSTATFAATELPVEQEQEQPAFIKITGTVESVEVRSNATYFTLEEGDLTNRLAITEDTQIFDNTGKKVELKKGDQVVAYSDADKPMILIYPPEYNPEVVIVQTEVMSMADVGTFDKNLLDKDLVLKLNISEKTELSSLSGKKVTVEDLAEQDLLVFYNFTTRSFPAQTTPLKVVLLDHEEMIKNPVVKEIIATDFYEVDGVKMVPLRLIAEELGYKVKSTGKGAILSKEAKTFTLTRGEKMYSFNKALRYFEVAPALLEPGKTYVPVEFVQDLID